MSRVLVHPDLQAPFQHIDSIPFLIDVNDTYKCNEVINIGDEVDFSTLSITFDPDPDGMGFKDEYYKALEFLHELYDIWPNVKVCISNHTVRPLKKALNAGIPSVFLKTYSEFLEAPKGWEWADEWEIDGIRYIHGEGVSGQRGHIVAAEKSRISTVIGHIHAFGGLNYLNNYKGQLLFGMNVGCLIDVKSYAFKYGKHFLHKPTLGCGVVLDGIPLFIPMMVDKHGRWTGKLPR